MIMPKKKVLSPISQTKIARNDVVNEVKRLGADVDVEPESSYCGNLD